MSWKTGNGYRFQVYKTSVGYRVTNSQYSILMNSSVEAKMVANLLNDVLIANGDGISKKELLRKLSSMQSDYLNHDGITLSEKMLVKQIFRSVKELIE